MVRTPIRSVSSSGPAGQVRSVAAAHQASGSSIGRPVPPARAQISSIRAPWARTPSSTLSTVTASDVPAGPVRSSSRLTTTAASSKPSAASSAASALSNETFPLASTAGAACRRRWAATTTPRVPSAPTKSLGMS